MPHDISALMDGELDGHSAQTAIARLESKEDLRDSWATYHLIGDALRQEVAIAMDLTPQVTERLAAEPTVLAPRRRRIADRMKVGALSLAASLAAIAIVAWVMVQNAQDRQQEQLAAARSAIAAKPVSLPVTQQLNDYLIAHQEYSPSTAIQGVAPYVRTVADSQREARR
ncbi:MAG: sigma-E factor negative regulatory protein [Betaproteobacteria bacterium]|nr:sigma-E factor negative regulatory protein [Betaproteobacteria bacterium]